MSSGTALKPIEPGSALAVALDVVEAISRAGQVVVPNRPTKAMIDAGVEAGGISRPVALKVFRAMVAAAG
ncbi:MAG: hypothetical protein GC191_05775 [Azospirillum sp.]|nr:hypothetical protein [Azospirillum sp.]